MNAPGGTIRSLSGAGGGRTLTAVLDNQGTVAVHPASAGILNVSGSLTTTGVLDLELGGTTVGTQYDRLAVTGAATLGDTLNVTLINGFVPVVGNSFTILTRGSGSGTFSTVNLPTLPSGTWQVSYNPTSVVLTVQ